MTLLETLPESTWWVLASVLGVAVSANAAAYAARAVNRSLLRRLLRPTSLHAMAEFLYFVGLPYFALLAGAVAPLDFGLRGLSLSESAAVSGPYVLLMLALLTLMWLAYRNSLSRLDAASPPAWPPAVARSRRRSAGWMRHLVDALYAEAHLAFYRAWLMELAGLYVGAWLGFGLWGLEMLALPSFWRRPRRAATWEALGFRMVFGMVTTVTYLHTRSLWFGLLAHAGLQLGMAVVGQVSGPRAAAASEPREPSEGAPA